MPPFEESLERSPAGHLIRSVADIDAATKWGFTQDLADITARQFSALKVFKHEEQRRENEIAKSHSQDA